MGIVNPSHVLLCSVSRVASEYCSTFTSFTILASLLSHSLPGRKQITRRKSSDLVSAVSKLSAASRVTYTEFPLDQPAHPPLISVAEANILTKSAPNVRRRSFWTAGRFCNHPFAQAVQSRVEQRCLLHLRAVPQ